MKRNKGISLIVLVITIIVMIILAGSIILSLSNNGIIGKANEAAKLTQIRTEKDELLMLLITAIKNNGEVDISKLDSIIEKNDIFSGTNGIYTSYNGNMYYVHNDGEIEYIESVEDVEPEYIEKNITGNVVCINNFVKEQHELQINLESESITDFSNIKLKQYGTNLFNHEMYKQQNNINITYEEGVIKIVNNNSASKTIDFELPYLPGGTYILSCDWNKTLYCYTKTATEWSQATVCNANKVFSVNEDFAFRLRLFASPNETIELKNVQLQIGQTSTKYEAFYENEYTADQSGKVSGVKNISEIVTLLTNNENITINCTYKKQPELVMVSNVAGKKMAVIGDSISDGASSIQHTDSQGNPCVITAASGTNNLINNNSAWWQLVSQRYQIAEVISKSEVGACFSQDGSTKVDGVIQNPRFTTYLNTNSLPLDLEIIIVFGGTNDYGLDRPLGNITDAASTENQATFCAAVKATLEYLTKQFPKAEIIYFTPLPRCFQTGNLLTDKDGNYYIEGGEKYNELNKVGKLLGDYADCITQLCNMYNVKVCDLLSNSGMKMYDMTFRLTYAPDGLHPNKAGTELYVNNAIFPYLDSIWTQKIWK